MVINSQIYRLTFWSAIKPILWPLFVALSFTLVFIIILAFTSNSDNHLFSLIVGIVWIIITGIPPIVLEFNYLMRDWKTTLLIDHSNSILEFNNHAGLFRFQIQDITRIEKHHSGIERGDRVGRMHWHTYYYYKIYISGQEYITVSRMIVPKLEKKLENVKCELIWDRFPMIRS